MTWIRSLGLAAVLAAAACAPAPPVETRIAEGTWRVVARDLAWAVLARDGHDASRGAAVPDSVEVMIFEAGEARPERAAVVTLNLPGLPVERQRPLLAGCLPVNGEPICFGIPGAGPALVTSPLSPRWYLFEEAGQLWSLTTDGTVRLLSSEQVGGMDYRTLAARQREGEVILYWAASPVWSTDGQYVAYASNRRAVSEGTRGQAIWLLELATGREQPLLDEPGESLSPSGWLGDEVLFSGGRQPGLRAVHRQTRAVRRVSDEAVSATAQNGRGVALVSGAPRVSGIAVQVPRGRRALPEAPEGLRYRAQSALSPSGRRLLVEASGENAASRQFLVFDTQNSRIRRLPIRVEALDGWPTWLNDETVAVVTVDRASGTRTTAAVRVR